MTNPITEEFVQVRYDLLDQKLTDLRKYRREDFDDIQSKLDVIEAKVGAITAMIKAETVILGGGSAFLASLVMKFLGQE